MLPIRLLTSTLMINRKNDDDKDEDKDNPDNADVDKDDN